MEGGAQTWHYGLIAKWWAEFNDDFRPHEVPYFQRHIEQGGEPALEVGCGTVWGALTRFCVATGCRP